MLKSGCFLENFYYFSCFFRKIAVSLHRNSSIRYCQTFEHCVTVLEFFERNYKHCNEFSVKKAHYFFIYALFSVKKMIFYKIIALNIKYFVYLCHRL